MNLDPVMIELDRLRLREWTEEDYDVVHEYAQLEEVVRYQVWGPNDSKATRDFLNRAAAASQETPRKIFELAIEDKESKRVVGGCGLYLRSEDRKIAEIGFTLSPKFWGRGYATEAALGLVEYARALKCNRLYGSTRALNKASVRVLEKVGMVREKVLEKNIKIRGVLMDSYIYGMQV